MRFFNPFTPFRVPPTPHIPQPPPGMYRYAFLKKAVMSMLRAGRTVAETSAAVPDLSKLYDALGQEVERTLPRDPDAGKVVPLSVAWNGPSEHPGD